jgi:hypothetical protein
MRETKECAAIRSFQAQPWPRGARLALASLGFTKRCAVYRRSYVNDCPAAKAQSRDRSPDHGATNTQEVLMNTSQPQQPTPPLVIGSLDGSGAGDHDEPYRFGRRPNARAPFPFTERQYARLLVFRSRHQERCESRGQVQLRVLPGGLLKSAA